MGTLSETYRQGWRDLADGRLEALLDLYAPDVELKEAGRTFIGRDAVREQYQSWLDAFSDLRVELLDVIEGPNALAGEVRVTMTHTGTLQTPNGPVPPTGRTVVLESCDLAHLRDGRIVTFHSYFDHLSVLAQLGLLSSPEQPAASA